MVESRHTCVLFPSSHIIIPPTYCVLHLLKYSDEFSPYESSSRYRCYMHSYSHNHIFVCSAPRMDEALHHLLGRQRWLFVSTQMFLVIQLTRNPDMAMITLVKPLVKWVAWLRHCWFFLIAFLRHVQHSRRNWWILSNTPSGKKRLLISEKATKYGMGWHEQDMSLEIHADYYRVGKISPQYTSPH